jgi:hypothetical protein
MTDFSTAAPAIPDRQEAAAGGVSAPRDDSSDGLSSEKAGEHVRETGERIIEERGDALQILADHDPESPHRMVESAYLTAPETAVASTRLDVVVRPPEPRRSRGT